MTLFGMCFPSTTRIQIQRYVMYTFFVPLLENIYVRNLKFCKKPAFATILQSRERMSNWLVILLETGKSQSGLFTRVAHDMKLMLDFHKGCKLLD